MAEPITIGDQTFIKTAAGWVDKKSKKPADTGLLRLLNSMVINEAIVQKQRIKIDRTIEPISLNGQKYVYETNLGWIDEKTKIPVPKSLQLQFSNSVKVFRKGAAPNLSASLGMAGEVALQNVKKPSGAGKLPAASIKINSPIVQMIEKLAIIDGYLKQRLDNQKKISARSITMARETAIEEPTSDASPILEESKTDSKKNDAAAIGVALLVGGLIASQFEPVQDAFKAVADGIKGVWNFVSDTAKAISNGLDAMTGTSSTPTTSTSTNNVASSRPSSVEPSIPNITNETSEGAPSQPTEANPSVPLLAQSASDAMPIAPTQPPAASTSGPNRVGRAIIGASVGGAIGGLPGAVIGGAIGYLSAPAASSNATPAPTGAATGGSTSSVSPSTTSAPTETDAQAISTESTGSVIQVNHPETPAAGQIPKNDIVALGNYLVGQGAEKSKMEHPTLSGRVGTHGTNSRHYSGMAIDVNFPGPNEASLLDALEPQLRAAGYYTLWRKKDHYTHMHVSVGGPEGGDSYGSGIGEAITGAASTIYDLGAGAIEALAGIVAAGLGPMATRDITSSLVSNAPSEAMTIAAASVERTAAVAQARTESTNPSTIPDPINLNSGSDNPVVQSIPTSSDFAGVEFYLTRMGFPKITYNQNALAGMRA